MSSPPQNKPSDAPDLVQTALKAPGDPTARYSAIKGAQIVSERLAALSRKIDLAEYAAAGYPDLRRATPVSVYRPWSWWRPLDSRLAQLIRRYQARILHIPETECTEHHVMLYLGNGWCASQDHEMGLVHLESYKGCRLTFWDWPLKVESANSKRDHLGMEMVVRKGDEYAYSDILGLAALALTGSEALLKILSDNSRMICSERLCHETRDHFWPGFAGHSTCLRAIPQWISGWMQSNRFRPTVLEIT